MKKITILLATIASLVACDITGTEKHGTSNASKFNSELDSIASMCDSVEVHTEDISATRRKTVLAIKDSGWIQTQIDNGTVQSISGRSCKETDN